MTKDEQKPAQSLRTSAKSEARASKKTEARSAALRANLLKRKAQVKTRADNGAKQNAVTGTAPNKKED